MSFENYTALSEQDALKEFGVNPEKGLSKHEVASLHRRYGTNELINNEIKAFHIFIRQFKSAFIYLLLGASLVTFLLKEYVDSIFILVFVLINVFLGFYQEYKSEQTAKFLKKYTNKRATVVRDGKEVIIDAVELVPGDIVLIETGDIIPADIRLLETNDLLVDESTLTGESVQIRKQVEKLEKPQKEIYKALNIAFSGTTVAEGKGLGVVISTGKNSQFGKIAKLATEAEETSAFEKNINKFSKFILFLTVTTLALVFIVHIFFKDTLSFFDLTLFSIALAVGAIPEAMPLVTTFSLSIGANKLAKKKVIVKRLSAIEDMGGIQVLCTDKTGTITENKLQVWNMYSDDKEKLLFYSLAGATSLEEEKTPNNSFDLALLEKAGENVKESLKGVKKIFEIPFNPSRRRNSVLIPENSAYKLIVRGAAESIIPHIENLSVEKKEHIENWISSEGKSGNRVIAVAVKEVKGKTYTIKDEESGLQLLGFVSFFDPIKESTHVAVKKAKELGVTVKIITGDSAEVAGAVALQVGICDRADDVLTGDALEKIPRAKQKEIIKKINVFARMSPEQKYNLIKLLQEDQEVGFLGEGINDAPALKAAGVSIVVDHAADVSREVADIILLKHDLNVIIEGIEMGRKTFVNVTNYVKASMASNFGNFYAMAFVTLMIDFLPMLPIQILLVNLLSDFPMISIATDSVDRKDILDPKSYSVKELLLVATVLGLVSSAFDFLMFGVFSKGGAQELQTYWFIGSILTELILIYSIRTKGWFFKVKNFPSKQIVILTAVAAVVTVAIPFTPIGTDIFKFIVPSSDKIVLILGIVAAYMFSTEVAKKMYYRYVHTAR